jgi:hypothetical protein
VTTFKPIEKLYLFLMGSSLVLPILIQHFVGQLPFVNYNWIASTLPKIEPDYQKFAQLHGFAEADRYRKFFITCLVLSNLYFVSFLALYVGKLWRGTFDTGLRPLDVTANNYSEQVKRRHFWSSMAVTFLFLLIWVFPTSVLMSPGIGYFEIRPGFRAEVLMSLFFATYAIFLPMFLIAIIRFVRR